MIFYVYKVSETLTESIFNVYYEYQQIVFLDPEWTLLGGPSLVDPPWGTPLGNPTLRDDSPGGTPPG